MITDNDLKSMIEEIKQNGNYSASELQIIQSAVSGYIERCHKQYRYYSYFTIPTGKKYGDALEERIRESFIGFTKPDNDTSYDALTSNGEKVEIKSLRACTKGQTQIFLKDDTVSASKFSTSSYQQTKPSCCAWFLFHILYGDGSRLFVIPSEMISSHPGEDKAEDGKIPLSIQHRGHDSEGQVNLGQVIKYASVFEITDYSIEEKYDFADFQEIVVKRLDAIDWKLRS